MIATNRLIRDITVSRLLGQRLRRDTVSYILAKAAFGDLVADAMVGIDRLLRQRHCVEPGIATGFQVIDAGIRQ